MTYASVGAQIRPGGLAAFPVDVVGTGGAADEEGLAIIVEVPRGARPTEADVQALASHVRATVRVAARVHGLGL